MPIRGKRLRIAREKHYHGSATFTKHATSPSSTDDLNYCASEHDPDAASTTEAESSEDSEAENWKVTPIEGLQRLYSVFLPPHLWLKEMTRQKRKKVANRPPVYTKDSCTTAWQKNSAQRKAAEGCTSFDAFITKTVCSQIVSDGIDIKHLIAIRLRSSSVALHQR